MDEIAQFNISRWEALVKANAPFARPCLSLDAESAREHVDPYGILGDVRGRRILCLAAGGGSQSAAFALLGADVIVFDISEAQLDLDRQAASHYGVSVAVMQGDMRDLSALAPASFDVVCHGFSLGFVPEARVVFEQVARVLRPGGVYTFANSNPFFTGLAAQDWNGEGYTIKLPYTDGAPVRLPDAEWVWQYSAPADLPASEEVRYTREYRQTLSKVLNSLIGLGFNLLHIMEYAGPGDNAEPGGSWPHFISVAPPWLEYWLRYEPDRGAVYERS